MQIEIALVQKNKDWLRQKTISGIGWTILAKIGKQLLQFFITIILARLLTPKDFGLVGMVIVFTGFATLFGELGFGAALIQKEKLEERHYSSIFWLNLLAGLILTVIIIAVAPIVAAFYNEPRLTALTMFIALNFLINSLNIVQNAVLYRTMDFRALALIEVTTMIVSGMVAIVLAMKGFGVWSLVWQTLIASSITAVLFWWVSDWRPHLIFDRLAVAELLKFSTNLLGFKVFNYWERNGDNMLIGKYIGSDGLGIYARAYTTMLLPLCQITDILTRVMFPVLSRIQNDKPRVKCIYLRAVAMIALITFPMMMGLLVVAEHFVLALYGPKWAAAIPILKILSLLGMAQSIITTTGWIYQSQGRTDWMFKWGLGTSVLYIGSFVVGILIGTVKAVAVSYALTECVILLYPVFAIPGKLIDMTFSDVVRAVSDIFGCAATMALLVWGVGFLLPTGWTHWVYLAIQVLFGLGVYLALLYLFDVKALHDIREVLSDWLQRRKKQEGKY